MTDSRANDAAVEQDENARSKPLRYLSRFGEEIGLQTLYNAPRDAHLLILQRFVRLFAYGGSTLVLIPYLRALGNSETRCGAFMTLTLIGDVVISFFLTLFADSLGRKAILAVGSALMTASGIAFALSGRYEVLLVAAILGVISPAGNEIGPFRAVEESTLAHLTVKEKRSDIFAWYSLLGTGGAAMGLITCGWVVDVLHKAKGWDKVSCYRVVFWAYASVGVVKFLLAMSLTKKVEADKKQVVPQSQDQDQTGDESAPLLGGDENGVARKKEKKSWLPHISKESRPIVLSLCLLFALDSFASGLAPLSWVTYFFKTKFDMREGTLGTLFFATAWIQAASMLVASSIAKRIGNVKTMAFTHLPSAIALALIPLPNSLTAATALLVIRSSMSSMDVAPRSAFLSAVVLPNERTAVMGTINVVKTSSQSLGPLITGILASKHLFGLAFLLAGGLKVIYDLSILGVFAGHKPREEEAANENANVTASG